MITPEEILKFYEINEEEYIFIRNTRDCFIFKRKSDGKEFSLRY